MKNSPFSQWKPTRGKLILAMQNAPRHQAKCTKAMLAKGRVPKFVYLIETPWGRKKHIYIYICPVVKSIPLKTSRGKMKKYSFQPMEANSGEADSRYAKCTKAPSKMHQSHVSEREGTQICLFDRDPLGKKKTYIYIYICPVVKTIPLKTNRGK